MAFGEVSLPLEPGPVVSAPPEAPPAKPWLHRVPDSVLSWLLGGGLLIPPLGLAGHRTQHDFITTFRIALVRGYLIGLGVPTAVLVFLVLSFVLPNLPEVDYLWHLALRD